MTDSVDARTLPAAQLKDESPEWLDMEDFAEGIDTNRLPRSGALSGRTVTIALAGGGEVVLEFGPDAVAWSAAGVPWAGSGSDHYEAVEIGVGAFWVDFSIAERQVETVTVAFSPEGGWALAVHSIIHGPDFTTETRVMQSFHPGRTGPNGDAAILPGPTRDLIGKRTLFRYSANHLYEHIYLSSRRFTWHNLIGEQRGHAASELATTCRLEEGMYLFTWREEKIPVGTVFVFDYARGRSTGKFIGLTGDGVVANSPGGAEIIEFGYSDYSRYVETV